jgi:hypothetical protein
MKHFYLLLQLFLGWLLELRGPVAGSPAPQSQPPGWVRSLIIGLLATGIIGNASAQSRVAPPLFREDAAARAAASTSLLSQVLIRSRAFSVDISALQASLAAAPLENSPAAQSGSSAILTLPLPDGSTARFRVLETPILAPALAARYPNIHTYSGLGLDDPTTTLRCDLTPLGFHAQILGAAGGPISLDPVSSTDQLHYLSFYRRDLNRGLVPTADCATAASPSNLAAPRAAQASDPGNSNIAAPAGTSSGPQLRTYRLAIACTGEYFVARQGMGTPAQRRANVTAAIATTVNRVVGVYEKEIAVRMVIIATNDNIVYDNGATDPYTNGNVTTQMAENQANLDNVLVIGSANYDIGHVFSTAGSGVVAQAGVACQAGLKARGATGRALPVGDAFDIDYVAHEMGHQLGANHTFNAVSGGCGNAGQYQAATAFEPGSGSTLMSYAGICGVPNNLQANADPYFHSGSFDEIRAYVSGTGLGAGCGTTTATGNTAPTVTGPANGKTLPISTPFKLTAVGADPDGDALTYCWEQFDLRSPGQSITAAQVAGQNIPLFRSYLPLALPTRYFPRLDSLRANVSPRSERLPTVTRTLKFRCTARDQHLSPAGVIGGVSYSADVTMNVTSTAGPFVVTAPNAALNWAAGTQQLVQWNVANTTAAPVSCATVNIRLSTDGGQTYPVLIAGNVPNSGVQGIVVPNNATAQARIMVEAADNYFFDISDANFTITGSAGPIVTSVSPGVGPIGTVVTISGSNFTGATAVTIGGVAATNVTVNSATQITATVAPTTTGGAVQVTTPIGASNANVPFTVFGAPTLTSLSPAVGSPGDLITITGTGFAVNMTLTFNGVQATYTIVNASTITATVPALATAGNVVVVTPGGTSNGRFFTVTGASPPPISLIISTPQTVNAGPYNNITVTATGTANINGAISVAGTLLVQTGGVLNTQLTPIVGGGAFTLEAGATISTPHAEGISASGATGVIQLAGVRSFSPDATYIYNNTVNAQTTGTGLPATVANLSVTGVMPVTLTRTTTLTRMLSLMQGELVMGPANLLLASNPSGTAMVVHGGGQLTNPSGTGTVTMQRYANSTITPYIGPGYHFYSSPIIGATLGQLAAPGLTPRVNAAFNALPTPNLPLASFPNVYRYNQDRLTAAFPTFTIGWESPASLGEQFGTRGYTVNTVPTTVSLSGPGLNTGDRPTGALGRGAQADAGWHLLGNPYPAPLNWSLVTAGDRPGLDGAIYVFEPTSQYGGFYRSFVGGIGTGGFTGVMAAMQGFFVRATAPAPAGFTFKNTHRVTTYQNPGFSRPAADARPRLRLTLGSTATAATDEAVVYLQAGASPNAEPETDAPQLRGPDVPFSLASLVGTDALSINGLPLLSSAQPGLRVPLELTAAAAGSYLLAAAELVNFAASTPVLLLDYALGTTTDLRQQASYRFALSQPGLVRGRFELVLGRPATVTGTLAASASGFSLWPNPTALGQPLHLMLPTAATAQARLHTLLGQVVARHTFSGATTDLPTAGLAAGTYLLTVQVAGQAPATRRVVLE